MDITGITDIIYQDQLLFIYLKILLVIIAAFFIITSIGKHIKQSLSNTLLPVDVQFLLQKIVVYTLWFAVLMYVVIKLEFDEIFLPLMGASILIGAAITLAIKDVLADTVAGIFLLIDKHFNIGDKIKTMNHSGKILDVTLRKTRIKAEDGTIVVLPNRKIDSSGWVLYKRNMDEEN